MKRFKIILRTLGDDPRNKVIDLDTGLEIPGVRSVEVHSAIGQVTTVRLELLVDQVEIDAERHGAG